MEAVMKRAGSFPRVMLGLGTNLGSSITAELISRAGFDWIWIDYEHGPGDETTLLHQLQAVSATHILPVVRVAWNDPVRVKRALDLGAGGIMFPYVNSAEEARAAVSAMRYPPEGIRGVAKFTRAAGFAQGFEEYFTTQAPNLLTVVQVETPHAVEHATEIAAVEGVDVLFVGPLDLTTTMGIRDEYDNPRFIAALETVAGACRTHSKRAGILVPGRERLGRVLELGYTFLVIGSDGGLLAAGMKELREETARAVNEHGAAKNVPGHG
jgi:4-hydroxy-2-oxoheptanedioate aldolase